MLGCRVKRVTVEASSLCSQGIVWVTPHGGARVTHEVELEEKEGKKGSPKSTSGGPRSPYARGWIHQGVDDEGGGDEASA